MELIYFKLNNYKCIREAEIFFNSSYELKRKKKLVKKSILPLHPYDIFNNITAFVGVNGSGKSTLLEAISKMITASGDFIKGTLIVKIENDLYYIGEKTKITFNGVIVKPIDPVYLYRSTVYRAIYYSPNYSPHTDVFKTQRSNYSNISNDFLYKSTRDKNMETDLSFQFEFLDKMSDFANLFLDFDKKLEISLVGIDISIFYRRLISIIESATSGRGEHYEDIKRFAQENKIYLANPLDHSLNHFENNKKNIIAKDLKKRFEEIESKIYRKTSRAPLEIQIQFNFSINYLKDSMSAKKTRSTRFQLTADLLILSHILKLSEEDNLDQWSSVAFYDLFKSSNPNLYDFKKWEIGMLKLSNVLSMYAQGRRFPISFSTSQSVDAIRLISGLRKENLLQYGVSVKWKGLSSGQIAKLNFYSRLFSELLKLQKQNVTLILDEADIYLHPEWQRLFLNDLSKFLHEVDFIKKNQRQYQLIITTHSPLMISDLFKEDVHIIKKNKERSVVKMAKNETFGANIFNLYREEFVLNSPRGQLADSFINKLFKDAKKRNINKNELLFTAEKIGERVIKIGLINTLEDNVKS